MPTPRFTTPEEAEVSYRTVRQVYDPDRCAARVRPATGARACQCKRAPSAGPSQLYCRQHSGEVADRHPRVTLFRARIDTSLLAPRVVMEQAEARQTGSCFVFVAGGQQDVAPSRQQVRHSELETLGIAHTADQAVQWLAAQTRLDMERAIRAAEQSMRNRSAVLQYIGLQATTATGGAA